MLCDGAKVSHFTGCCEDFNSLLDGNGSGSDFSSNDEGDGGTTNCNKKKSNSSKQIHARAASIFGAQYTPGVAAAASPEVRLFNSVTPTNSNVTPTNNSQVRQ